MRCVGLKQSNICFAEIKMDSPATDRQAWSFLLASESTILSPLASGKKVLNIPFKTPPLSACGERGWGELNEVLP
jgi:hypothetical protein